MIESDPHRHFLQPEQEIRNYVLAIDYLEKRVKAKALFDLDLILHVQALVEKGASKEKINRCAKLVQGGFLEPQIANERIMTYRLSDLTKANERKLLRMMK